MISIIIPAFNEEKRIGRTLEKLASFLKNFKEETEVIVVDDASTDKTIQVAESFSEKIKNLAILRLAESPLAGKGYAVGKGVLNSSGDFVLFTDADGSTPIEEIEKLLAKIRQGYDIAIGSRALERGSVKRKQNILREVMGRSFNILVRTLTVKDIVDTQCGFKLFKRESTIDIFKNQKIFDFGFDVELLYVAKKHGLKIAEVPVLWYNDPHSSVHPIKDSLKMLVDLFKIRLFYSDEYGSVTDRIFYLIYRYRTFWQFSIVGVTNTIVDIGTLYILTRSFGAASINANQISVEVAIVWSFFWNNLWTFSKRNIQDPFFKRFFIFQFVSLGGYVLNQIIFLILLQVFSIYDLSAKLLTVPAVLIFNYLVNSRWTFRDVESGKASWYYYGFIILVLFLIYYLLSVLLHVPILAP